MTTEEIEEALDTIIAALPRELFATKVGPGGAHYKRIRMLGGRMVLFYHRPPPYRWELYCINMPPIFIEPSNYLTLIAHITERAKCYLPK